MECRLIGGACAGSFGTPNTGLMHMHAKVRVHMYKCMCILLHIHVYAHARDYFALGAEGPSAGGKSCAVYHCCSTCNHLRMKTAGCAPSSSFCEVASPPFLVPVTPRFVSSKRSSLSVVVQSQLKEAPLVAGA